MMLSLLQKQSIPCTYNCLFDFNYYDSTLPIIFLLFNPLSIISLLPFVRNQFSIMFPQLSGLHESRYISNRTVFKSSDVVFFLLFQYQHATKKRNFKQFGGKAFEINQYFCCCCSKVLSQSISKHFPANVKSHCMT